MYLHMLEFGTVAAFGKEAVIGLFVVLVIGLIVVAATSGTQQPEEDIPSDDESSGSE
jgi:hypothetical protein